MSYVIKYCLNSIVQKKNIAFEKIKPLGIEKIDLIFKIHLKNHPFVG